MWMKEANGATTTAIRWMASGEALGGPIAKFPYVLVTASPILPIVGWSNPTSSDCSRNLIPLISSKRDRPMSELSRQHVFWLSRLHPGTPQRYRPAQLSLAMHQPRYLRGAGSDLGEHVQLKLCHSPSASGWRTTYMCRDDKKAWATSLGLERVGEVRYKNEADPAESGVSPFDKIFLDRSVHHAAIAGLLRARWCCSCDIRR